MGFSLELWIWKERTSTVLGPSGGRGSAYVGIQMRNGAVCGGYGFRNSHSFTAAKCFCFTGSRSRLQVAVK